MKHHQQTTFGKITLVGSTFALLLTFVGTANAEWGTLKGKFVYDGDAPAPAKLEVNKDVAFCGAHKGKLVDESLVVGADGGIQNIVIWLYPGDVKPEVHPSYRLKIRRPVTIDNEGCRFEPHVSLVHTGQPVTLKNSDKVVHNTKVDTFSNDPINPTLPIGGELKISMELGERLPTAISCSIHPWMKSWAMILDHPYAAITDASGEFEIKNLPAGKWTFRVWQEKAGYVREVKVGGTATAWDKGLVEVDIPADGETDLGTVSVAPALFAE